jgi:tRNA(Ile)-lysidine synthetase-like protein
LEPTAYAGVTETPLGDIVLNVTEKADNENIQKVHNKLLDYSIDYDKINGSLVARCRLPGDKIRFVGREHTASVKKLLNARKIPVEEREQVLILSDDLVRYGWKDSESPTLLGQFRDKDDDDY